MPQTSIIDNAYTQPGSQSLAFSYLLSTYGMPFYLTILNIFFSRCSLSTTYKDAMLLSAKPVFQLLNNFHPFSCACVFRLHEFSLQFSNSLLKISPLTVIPFITSPYFHNRLQQLPEKRVYSHNNFPFGTSRILNYFCASGVSPIFVCAAFWRRIQKLGLPRTGWHFACFDFVIFLNL